MERKAMGTVELMESIDTGSSDVGVGKSKKGIRG